MLVVVVEVGSVAETTAPRVARVDVESSPEPPEQAARTISTARDLANGAERIDRTVSARARLAREHRPRDSQIQSSTDAKEV